MADLLPSIRKRRSIRKYTKRRVELSKINKVLEAGRWAPSGLNNQPWRFLVIRDEIRQTTLAGLTRYGHILKNAPCLIVVCMDNADSYNREKDLMSCGACIENMLLEATALGLGTCWLGEILNKRDAAERALGLDPDLELVAVVAMGYPAHKPKGCRKALERFRLSPA